MERCLQIFHSNGPRTPACPCVHIHDGVFSSKPFSNLFFITYFSPCGRCSLEFAKSKCKCCSFNILPLFHPPIVHHQADGAWEFWCYNSLHNLLNPAFNAPCCFDSRLPLYLSLDVERSARVALIVVWRRALSRTVDCWNCYPCTDHVRNGNIPKTSEMGIVKNFICGLMTRRNAHTGPLMKSLGFMKSKDVRTNIQKVRASRFWHNFIWEY